MIEFKYLVGIHQALATHVPHGSQIHGEQIKSTSMSHKHKQSCVSYTAIFGTGSGNGHGLSGLAEKTILQQAEHMWNNIGGNLGPCITPLPKNYYGQIENTVLRQ